MNKFLAVLCLLTLGLIPLSSQITVIPQQDGSGGILRHDSMSYTAAVAEACNAAAETRIIFLQNSIYDYVRCESSVWVPYRNSIPRVPPVLGSFTRINAGSETVSTTNGGSLISFPATSTTYSPKGWVKAEPAGPYTITACAAISSNSIATNMPFFLGWMDGATTADDSLAVYLSANSTGLYDHHILFSTPYLTPTTNVLIQNALGLNFSDFCYRIAVDDQATPRRTAYFSNSGLAGTFIKIYDVTHTTTITPTHVILGGHARNATYPVTTWVYHYQETSP